MLYFSETVCVLTLSSSLPAREGDLESANGSALISLASVPLPSEAKLVLRVGVSTGELGADSSSRKRRDLELEGGIRRVSDDPVGRPEYILLTLGLSRSEGLMGDLD